MSFQLKQQVTNLLKEARAITERADSSGRGMTESERATVRENIEKAGQIMNRIKSSQDIYGRDDELRASLKGLEGIGMVGDEYTPGPGSGNTHMNAKVRATGGTGNWANSVQRFSELMGQKSLVANGSIPVTVPLQTDVVEMSTPVLSLRQLLRTVKNDTGRFSYMRQTTRTNNASTVAAGKKKPTSIYTVTRYDDRVRTIAHLSEPVNRFDIDDAGFLQGFLESEMRLGLELELEDQILNAAGSSAGVLDDFTTGLLNVSGSQSQAWDTDIFTTTRKAVTKLESNNITPTGWVMNPSDWETFELSEDNEGRPTLSPETRINRAARRLWGLPVALSTQLAAGTTVLADFNNIVLHVREEGNLSWTENMWRANQYGADAPGTDFESNQVTFRFEGRFGLQISLPFSIVEVDLTA